MQTKTSFKFYNEIVVFPLFFTLFIWVVFWVEISFGFDFSNYGIFPRTLSGLKGIFFSPFIHGSLKHLYNNTLPIFILLSALFYFYAEIRWKIIFYGIILSGFLTWLFARETYHIGLSGFIYVLVSFLFFKGIFTKYYRLIAVSFIVIFLYGNLLWYVFPIEDEMSWEGHLSGFATGLLLAAVCKQNRPNLKRNGEDNDPFLRHFDEDGNFISESELKKEKNANH